MTNFFPPFRQSYLSRLFQTRGLSHLEMASVFLPHLSKFFSGSIPQDAVEIGLFPGSAPLKGDHRRELDLLQPGNSVDEVDPVDDAKDFVIEEFD